MTEVNSEVDPPKPYRWFPKVDPSTFRFLALCAYVNLALGAAGLLPDSWESVAPNLIYVQRVSHYVWGAAWLATGALICAGIIAGRNQLARVGLTVGMFLSLTFGGLLTVTFFDTDNDPTIGSLRGPIVWSVIGGLHFCCLRSPAHRFTP